MNTDTRQFVIRLFAWVVASICGFMAIVLGVRVAIDGNAPLTLQITQGFISELPQLVAFLTGVIIGEPVASALVERIRGAGAPQQTPASTAAPATGANDG